MADNNLKKIRRLRKISELIYNQDMMNKVGETYELIVRNRTRAGKDVDGQSFQPYSPGYIGVRVRASEPTHTVNLTMDHISGMLTKIDHRVFNDLTGVEAFINDPGKAQIARYHAIEGAGKSKVIRKFWGLSDSELTEISKVVRLLYNDFQHYQYSNFYERLRLK